MTCSSDQKPGRLGVYIRLGRVSNLPTVWTNGLAGTVLAGGDPWDPGVVGVVTALSLFYMGGMWLNDAFDHRFDVRFRPERPIPSRAIGTREVYLLGFGQLILAELLLVVTSRLGGGTGSTPEAAAWGLWLGAVIVYYDVRHKIDAFSPLVMGVCRMAVYCVAAAVATTAFSAGVLLPALILTTYVAGLTQIAKGESRPQVGSRWPLVLVGASVACFVPPLVRMDAAAPFVLLLFGWVGATVWTLWRGGPARIPFSVVRLIAGISLVDAALVAAHGRLEVAALSVGGFLLTLWLQRAVAGT